MNLPKAVTALIAALVVGEVATAANPQTLPIDRWLISEAFVSDSPAGSRLQEDLLDAPGEAGVLPDRGRKAAGTTWRLHRTDGSETDVSLDVPAGSVVYAHVYVRLPEDRTLRLAWSPEGCTAGRLWLNGRPTSGREFPARFGAGWNTILIKLESGECGFGFEARLLAPSDATLDGVRVQASRPPGDVRTGPEPWVIPADTAFVSADRRWSDDRLYAGLGVTVTAWGRAAIPGVGVELRGAAEGRGESQWMTPGEATEVIVPVRLDRLDRVLREGVVQSRLRWDGGRLETSLVVSGAPDEMSSMVILDGWDVSGGDDSRAARMPTAAGWKLAGQWKVPAALDGRRLSLVTTGAPGDYRVNGGTSPGEPIVLCDRCRRGTRLTISAVSAGPWERLPAVDVSAASGQ